MKSLGSYSPTVNFDSDHDVEGKNTFSATLAAKSRGGNFLNSYIVLLSAVLICTIKASLTGQVAGAS